MLEEFDVTGATWQCDMLVYNAYCEELAALTEKARKPGPPQCVQSSPGVTLRGCGTPNVTEMLDNSWQKSGWHQKSNTQKLSLPNIKSPHGRDGKTGNKLRTYRLLKTQYIIEPYITNHIPAHMKRAISKIRIGDHDLEIERGRWAKPKPIPAENRYCRYCRDVTETEFHFITECPLYSQPRADLLKACPHIMNQDPEMMFIAILSPNNVEECRQVANFICRSLNKRKCLLYDV